MCTSIKMNHSNEVSILCTFETLKSSRTKYKYSCVPFYFPQIQPSRWITLTLIESWSTWILITHKPFNTNIFRMTAVEQLLSCFVACFNTFKTISIGYDYFSTLRTSSQIICAYVLLD